MSKPKYASLTAGLLARKGEAAPTAQPFSSMIPALAPGPALVHLPQRGGGLGGLIQRAHPPAALREDTHERTSALSPSAMDRAAPQSAPSMHEPARKPAPPRPTATCAPSISALGEAQRRHGVTVRLDGPRYRRLMIVAARYGRTYQDILARALDVYMTALGIEDPAAGEQNVPGKPQ